MPVQKRKKEQYRVEWEIFNDSGFFGMWAVRPVGDRDFDSPRCFHFVYEADAVEFKRLLDISSHAVKA